MRQLDSLNSNQIIAQSTNPSKSDWVKTVTDDLNNLEIQLTFNDIKNISKSMFKQLVKEKVKTKAFEYLTSLQEMHSKSKELNYSELQLQYYLRPGNSLTIKEKAFIFSARSRMLDIKCNFKFGKSEFMCRKCNMAEEQQKHILICPKLNDNSLMNSSPIIYEDLLGVEVNKIELIGRILMKRFKALITDTDITHPMCTNNILCAASAIVEDLE